MTEARRRTVRSPRGVILAIVIAGLLFSAMYPMRRYFDARGSIEQLRADAVALDERIAELREEHRRLSSDEEVERLAREELQMVRPGEVAFVVVTPKPSPEAEPSVGPGGFEPPPRPDASLFSRWWEAARHAAGSFV